MPRYLFLSAVLIPLLLAGLFPLDRANSQTFYAANLDASKVESNVSDSTATGTIFFTLNEAGTLLRYSLIFTGLDLEPVAANRTDANDVVGIHLHLAVPDVIGPHILNIFGIPGEDDNDLVVDFENESLTGIFDLSDASVDPVTGNLLPQSFPLTTKVIGNWLDELAEGELYLAVHTVGASVNAPGVAIRGNISQIPEPSTTALLISSILLIWKRRRR